jgi:hypothetical protein
MRIIIKINWSKTLKKPRTKFCSRLFFDVSVEAGATKPIAIPIAERLLLKIL